MEIDFELSEKAKTVELMQGLERTGGRTVTFVPEHYRQIFRAFIAAIRLGAPANSSLDCAGADITSSTAQPSAPATTASAATTTFSITLPTTQNTAPCVTMVVAKVGNQPSTVITSDGFNTCSAGSLQLERTLQPSY